MSARRGLIGIALISCGVVAAGWWSSHAQPPAVPVSERLATFLKMTDVEISGVQGIDEQVVRDAAWQATTAAGLHPRWRTHEIVEGPWITVGVHVGYYDDLAVVQAVVTARTYATQLGGTEIMPMDVTSRGNSILVPRAQVAQTASGMVSEAVARIAASCFPAATMKAGT